MGERREEDRIEIDRGGEEGGELDFARNVSFYSEIMVSVVSATATTPCDIVKRSIDVFAGELAAQTGPERKSRAEQGKRAGWEIEREEDSPAQPKTYVRLQEAQRRARFVLLFNLSAKVLTGLNGV